MTRDFEERRKERVQRFKERAEAARAQANRLGAEGRRMLEAIPFGQPILVGHHSERRDRNYRKRAGNKIDRAIAEGERADHWEQQAASAENNRAIFGDDPEAVEKLAAKIQAAEKSQETMKAANRLLKKKGGPDRDGLHAMGFTDARIAELLKPDFAGRIGFPDYALQNNNANIRRMRERLEELKKKAEAAPEEKQIGAVRIVQNTEENRTQVFFPQIPSEKTRDFLKSRGFRWSRFHGAWQRHLSNQALYLAEQAAQMEAGEGAQ
jgi:hypothetical protein